MSGSTHTYIGVYFQVPAAFAPKVLQPGCLSEKLGREFQSAGQYDQFWIPRDDEVGIRIFGDHMGGAVELDIAKVEEALDSALSDYAELLYVFGKKYGASLDIKYGCVSFPGE